MNNQEVIEKMKYRIKTATDIAGKGIDGKAYEDMEMAIQALEKQIPKIPDIYGDGYDDKGNMIYDMYTCPNCGENYEIDYDHYEYCPKCGQHMDKSDKVFE